MSWRAATASDHDAVVAGSLRLYQEDPSPHPVGDAQIRATLQALRGERGRVVVLGQPAQGYAMLVAYWSNELGGPICVIDELWVAPEARGQGHGGTLLDRLIARDAELWPLPCVALLLEVSPENRAADLYQRKGFAGKNRSWRRVL